MATLKLQLAEIPACITESVRVCLAAHGLSLSEPVLLELGRNVAQSLCSIDTNLDGEQLVSRYFLRPCGWCGYTHRFTTDANDASKCPNCKCDLSPIATRFEESIAP